MADGGRIPRVLVEASALRSLPLGAADGFVLSRITGKVSEKELASLTGLPEMQIRTSLDKLFSLKVIDFGGPAPLPPKSLVFPAMPTDRGSQPTLPPAPGDAKVAPGGVQNALLATAILGITDSAPELSEAVDLPTELRRRVLGLHSVIASLDHYALLALPRDADKKAIKRSYFELAAVFHPDRYFRKNLGSFKTRMEVIFGKVSTAYETLIDKERRVEYDLQLGDVDEARSVESMLRDVMAEVDAPRIEAPPPDAPEPTKHASGSYSVAPMRPASVLPPPAPASIAPPSAPRTSDVSDQLRREALAMRLKGVRVPAKVPEKPPSMVSPAARGNPTEAVDALKRRYEERVEAEKRLQGDKYVKLGETAESRNDLTAAAAAYRVALTFLKEDSPAYTRARDVVARSELVLGEGYMKQGHNEERAGKWEEAAKSWGKAVKLRPNDHVAHERFANALVKSAGDLREATRVVQRAIALSPTVGDYRCTLATVYIAAGLVLNARRELESAAAQFPQNPTIPILLKKLAKPA